MLLESSVSEKYSSKRLFIPHITNSFIDVSLFKVFVQYLKALQ